MSSSHRPFKQQLYSQFARVGRALASPIRLEVLDLLAQGPRHVEALAAEMETSVASVSQHLQVLRNARLVDTDRQGTRVHYRLADPQVLHLWLALRDVAESQLAEVDKIVRESGLLQLNGASVSRDEVQERLAQGEILLLDVRPRLEYESGHLPGAWSFPLDELPRKITELPTDRDVVVYCRGSYCVFADEAIALLEQHGFKAHRLEGGWPEWADERGAAAGHPGAGELGLSPDSDEVHV